MKGLSQLRPSSSARRGRAARGKAGAVALRALLSGASLWFASSCHTELDTTRQAPPKATLGDDIYGVMCDRVGAGSLTEDITGASYHDVCHYDDEGHYGDKVDTSGLPPVKSAKTKEARRLGIAKVEAMARRRSDLIRALNAILPDSKIDDPSTDAPGDEIRLHDALMSLGQTLTPLYESNPFDPNGEPLMPSSTRALGRFFQAIQESPAARESLSRMWGRKGYRPLTAALGAVRSALAYPHLRDLTRSSVALLGPDGAAKPQLQQLLSVVKQELATSAPVVAPLPSYVVDGPTAQPNRPMTNSEMAATILMRGPHSQDDRFAMNDAEASRFIALRDRRGFVLPLGAQPGVSVAAPFTDTAPADGYADVDAFGRFLTTGGALLQLDAPFAIPGVAGGPADAYGRPADLPYQYVDTSRTVARSLALKLLPLVDPTQYGAPGDPEAWQSEYEGLMYVLGGAYTQYGNREPAQYDYATDTIHAAGESCSGCLQYSRFRAEDSPIPDLVHAAGQILADKDSDAVLLSTIDLLENHEQVVARVVGAALKVQEIAKAHDGLAAQGKEPSAKMPYETPIWDEMAAVLERIAERPGLTAKLLGGMADQDLVTPHDGAQHMGDALSRFMSFRDELTYDPHNINGPALNLTTGSAADPQTPVDRAPPLKGGANRSCFQRSLATIHVADGVTACNKDGGYLNIDLGWFSVSWPLFSTYSECELFTFTDLAAFYLDSMLPAEHPKRSELVIKDGALQSIIDFGGLFLSTDELFEQSAGLTGMTLHPDPAALNRLVFFGAGSDQFGDLPDRDTVNAGSTTDNFVSSIIEPVPTAECPRLDGVNHCTSGGEVLRMKDGASASGGMAKKSIFLWERFGFYDYLRPMVSVFANEACAPDLSSCDTTDFTGEKMFLDLIEVLHRHWAGKEHGAECSPSGDAKSNPAYCSEAGVNTYEPILIDAFETDLVPALHAFAEAVSDANDVITLQRGPDAGETRTNAEVLELLTKILFDSKHAAQVGMVDRKGHASTTWVSGTPQAQLTPFTLFTDALHKIDTRWDDACVGSSVPLAECQTEVARRKGQWKRARSQLVDQFLAVEGEGTSARFKNPGLAKTMVAVLGATREQLNAHCPNRESGEPCTWAKKDLGDKMAAVVNGPLFASMMDLQEAIRSNEPARRELERFVSYVLGACTSPSPPAFCPAGGGGDDALQATLASVVDILQVLSNDDNLAPIFNAIANVANPDSDPHPGTADTTINVLTAVTGDTYDRYHALDAVLPNLVTPMDGGQGPSPIEVLIDTVADVNRLDASSTDALSADDYEAIMRTVNEFLTSDTRGLEQFYFIVQNRPKE